jgi:hypothetical protein
VLVEEQFTQFGADPEAKRCSMVFTLKLKSCISMYFVQQGVQVRTLHATKRFPFLGYAGWKQDTRWDRKQRVADVVKQLSVCHHMVDTQAGSDIRGMEKLLSILSTPSVHGCFECWLLGVRIANKMVYCGHHVHLPLGHPLRAIIAKLNNPTREARNANNILAPAPRTSEQIKQVGLGQQQACSCLVVMLLYCVDASQGQCMHFNSFYSYKKLISAQLNHLHTCCLLQACGSHLMGTMRTPCRHQPPTRQPRLQLRQRQKVTRKTTPKAGLPPSVAGQQLQKRLMMTAVTVTTTRMRRRQPAMTQQTPMQEHPAPPR